MVEEIRKVYVIFDKPKHRKHDDVHRRGIKQKNKVKITMGPKLIKPRGNKRISVLPKYKSTKKYQEVPRSTEKYREVPRSTKKYREVPRSTKKYREVPRSTEKYKEVRKKYALFLHFLSTNRKKSVLLLRNIKNFITDKRIKMFYFSE
jgi:hypothetical protein